MFVYFFAAKVVKKSELSNYEAAQSVSEGVE